MQIIILRKNKTQSLKIQNWMYAAIFTTAIAMTSLPILSYLYFSNQSTLAKNLASSGHVNQDPAKNLIVNKTMNDILTEKVGQMQAQLLYLDQLLSSVKNKLNIAHMNSPHQNNNINHNSHNDNHNDNHTHDGLDETKTFQGQGGSIELTELDHPMIEKNKIDPAFAVLDGMSESEIQKLALNAQKKEFKGSSFNDLNQLVNQLGSKIQNRLQEVSSIDALLEFRNTKNIKFDIMPVQSARLTSGFGLRNDPFNGGRAMHTGQDFAGPVGTPIQAVRAGVVVASEYHPQYGNMIDIDHGDGLKTRYAHNSEVLLKVGSPVKKGMIIAKMGSTGRSTGSHLHFEVRLNNVPYNPVLFMSGSALAQR